jgi:hypothetical protein
MGHRLCRRQRSGLCVLIAEGLERVAHHFGFGSACLARNSLQKACRFGVNPNLYDAHMDVCRMKTAPKFVYPQNESPRNLLAQGRIYVPAYGRSG